MAERTTWSMKIESIKAQLTKVERQRNLLKQRMDEVRRRELSKLPEHVGLDSIDELILVLVQHASPALRERLARIESNDPRGSPDGSRRVRFAPELRERIRAELEAGGKSVAQLSREYGPSHPTIMGWKREWGLTRPRSRGRSSSDSSK